VHCGAPDHPVRGEMLATIEQRTDEINQFHH
jgi:hypothetical protein